MSNVEVFRFDIQNSPFDIRYSGQGNACDGLAAPSYRKCQNALPRPRPGSGSGESQAGSRQNTSNRGPSAAGSVARHSVSTVTARSAVPLGGKAASIELSTVYPPPRKLQVVRAEKIRFFPVTASEGGAQYRNQSPGRGPVIEEVRHFDSGIEPRGTGGTTGYKPVLHSRAEPLRTPTDGTPESRSAAEPP